MKNLVVFITLSFGMLFFAACGDSVEERTGLSNEEMTKILESKTWVLAEKEIMDDLATVTENQNRIHIVTLTFKKLKFATFDFYDGGKFKIDLHGSDPIQNGSYDFSPDGKILNMAFSNRPAIPHEIVSFTADKIVLKDNIDNGLLYKKIFIPSGTQPQTPTTH